MPQIPDLRMRLARGVLGAAVLAAFGLGPAPALSMLFLARAAHEDRFLRQRLEGCAEHAARVRFRLLSGVW